MKTFRHSNQPYGDIVFTIDKIEPVKAEPYVWNGKAYDPDEHTVYMAENGYVTISGIVLEGGVRNRLFQYTSFTDKTGEKYSLTVSPQDLKVGYRVDIAM